ncbi:plant virulence effector HPE1-like domain-containing protein [Gellertiella hungarica]|uniref:Uncharacterized protein n=1 Tax=Gellertiella hungarica TaxID=1572859 RepID=A0A7W6NKJ6_9HYPH|nr:plant virulence effector HPE1-like domain-containing protein [Gellertiella hungarica]MBB4064372.1 hypothetical protein [Gellertiella hungarica]
MRLFASLALLAFASAAHAGSVEEVTALPKSAKVESITVIGCGDCPAPAPKKLAYQVPVLKPGEQKLELRTVAGERKLFRTEAWLGGSPVVFVSTPSQDEIAALEGRPKQPGLAGDGIDKNATTAAVKDGPEAGSESGAKPPIAASMASEDAPAAAKPLDTSSFSLRTD